MQKSKTSQRRKRKKRVKRKISVLLNLDTVDNDAMRQGKAIVKHRSQTIQAPQLNKFYTCDDFKFGTGKKHRQGGYY